MRIFSKAKEKIGHFLLDHFVTQQIIKEWKASYIEDPLPQIEWPTQSMPALSPQPKEQNTGDIDERAVKEALQKQGKAPITEKVPAVSLDAATIKGLVDRLPAGEFIRIYRDTHRDDAVGEQTQVYRSVQRTGKLGGAL